MLRTSDEWKRFAVKSHERGSEYTKWAATARSEGRLERAMRWEEYAANSYADALDAERRYNDALEREGQSAVQTERLLEAA